MTALLTRPVTIAMVTEVQRMQRRGLFSCGGPNLIELYSRDMEFSSDRQFLLPHISHCNRVPEIPQILFAFAFKSNQLNGYLVDFGKR